MSRREFEMLKKEFESRSPCVLHVLPRRCRKGSVVEKVLLPRRCRKGSVVEKVSRKEKFSREVLQNKKLDSGAFELYLQNLWSSFSEDKKKFFTHLDSLWFTLYLNPTHKDKVLKWVKDKQIFSKKYVFVPIVCWRHWSLLIFCHLGTKRQLRSKDCCILLLDSLEIANPRHLEPYIRKFVSDIYRAEGRSTQFVSKIPLLVPKVPQQRNDKACGIYVLYFMNLFMENAPENFSIRDYPYFMEKNWFTSEDLDRFCERIRILSEDTLPVINDTVSKSIRDEDEVVSLDEEVERMDGDDERLKIEPLKKRKRKHVKKWSGDRYNRAEEIICEILKTEGAVFERPILRQTLEVEARKKIGDTGLMYHLMKHMVGKVAPGGTHRLQRKHNFDGAMEYWLESAD